MSFGIALAVTFVIAAVIGTVFGRAAATMTKPMSDSFRIFGPVWSGAAGLIVGIIAAFIIGTFWIIFASGVLGAVVGCAAVELQVWSKNHGW